MPIVAEESSARSRARARRGAVFFVDPIDGTRDYVAGREGYAVMIGLAVDGEARVGVLVLPAAHEAFVGIVGEGAHRVLPDGTRAPVSVSRLEDPSRARVLVSRSRRGPDVEEALARLGAADVRSMGSVGVKAARVAEGTADLYFYRGGRLAHWDTCGPEAVAGGRGRVHRHRRHTHRLPRGRRPRPCRHARRQRRLARHGARAARVSAA